MSDLLDSLFQRTNQRTLQYLDDLSALKPLGGTAIDTTLLPGFLKKHVGKVRDTYECSDYVVLVTTDRQSAFDRQLTQVPCKGQILNLTSLWWFNRTSNIVPNHVIASPHPNVLIAKKCTVFPVEFVMRGYVTGSTSTSLWTNYNKGLRKYCGHDLPEGLRKNQKLASNLITPTTKSDLHDELISAEEIIQTGLMNKVDWDKCASYAQALFADGQRTALERGLILVDTKYEMGKDPATGEILLIDEVQTPDSSRYWVAATYEAQMNAGKEPDNIDKEFLRRWFAERCDPYHDAVLPEAPKELVLELARRYILIYEVLTGRAYAPKDVVSNSSESVSGAVIQFFQENKSICNT